MTCPHGGGEACLICATVRSVVARRWRQVERQAAAPRAAGKAQRPIPAAAPWCMHRGAKAGNAPCQTCPSRRGERVELFACAVKGTCTVDPKRRAQGVQRCQTCAVEPKTLARELAPGVTDPIQTPAGPRERGWAWRPEVRDRHVAALQQVVRLTEGIEAPPRSGRGVLIVGGGRYWIGAVIACRLLRETGYAGRVLVWYRGKSEPIDAGQVAGLGVELTDADAFAESLPPPQRPRILDGWGAKTFAAMHCGLAEVLYLDADAYPVRDPSPLFGLLGSAPFVFWADHSPFNVWGPYHGLTPEQVQAVKPVQSGQMIIDVPRAWRTATVAHWIDQHADYFCPRNSEPRRFWHAFGDQDSWRVSLAYTGAPYLCVGPARWKDFHFTYEYEGETVIVHRCGSKLFPGAAPRWDDTLPLEGRVRELHAELSAPRPAHPGGMTEAQYARVEAEIRERAPCNVLIFGAGNDTGRYVAANGAGRTVVLEDRPGWLAAGRAAGAECHAVAYETRVDRGLRPDVPALDVPPDVSATRWDVILIDGPRGDAPDAPGRQQAAALAARLIAPGGVILAHDADRPHDAACYAHHLGAPAETVAGPPGLAVYRPVIQIPVSELPAPDGT